MFIGGLLRSYRALNPENFAVYTYVSDKQII
jgi:hypothetical protein